MKQCPKCNTACEDNDMVCKNCGYLFAPEGFNPGPYNQPPVQNNENNQYQQPPIQQPVQQPMQNNYGGTYQQAPMQNNNANPYNAEPKNSGISITSFVLGLIGTIFGCCYGLGLLTAIPGLITSIIALVKTKKSNGMLKGKGFAIAGLILSIVGIIFAAYIITVLIVNRDQFMDIFNKAMTQYKYNQYNFKAN